MLLLSFLLLFVNPDPVPGDRWSGYLERANASADNCGEFLDVMTIHKDDDATAMGYFALATMIQAKRYSNPFTKLSYFNKGKKILETVIAENPENAELRFLRFAVQVEVPAILLYYGDTENDQKILNEYLSDHSDGLAHRIRRFYALKDIKVNT